MESKAQSLRRLEAWLSREHGLLIDSSSAARILGYRSANTLAKARSSGALHLDMFPVPHRRGLFTSPHHLAACLQGILPPHHIPRAEAAMDG